MLHRHCRALKMPAGETNSPWRFPFLLTLCVLWGEFPERKVGHMALLRVFFHSRTSFLSHEIDVAELPVIFEKGCIEIDTIVGAVGIPLFLECLNECALLLYVIGGAGKCRPFRANIEELQVFEKRFRGPFASLGHLFAFESCTFFHLVFAFVRV